jgi:hypothetical protein
VCAKGAPPDGRSRPGGDAPGLRTGATLNAGGFGRLAIVRAAARGGRDHFHCAERGFSLGPPREGSRAPLTRAHVRLLGPCFKTGRKVARNSSPTDGPRLRRGRVDGSCRRASRSGAPGFGANGGAEAPPPRRTVTRALRPAPNESRRPSAGAKNPDRRPPRGSGGRRPVNSPGVDSRALSVYTRTVSRSYELSLQSSFQLSLTVLVHYRSRGRI